jgi:hypothetical protein
MIRKAVRSAMVLLAALAISLAVSAAPSSASAALGSRLCETSGKYCLGSDNLNLDTAVTEKLKSNNGGRDLYLRPISGTCCTDTGPGLPQYEIVFGSVNSPGGCVAVSNNGSGVVIHACTGGLGTVWGLQFNSNNHMQFINREASGTIFPLLEGRNNGSQYHIGQTSPLDFWTFDFVP